MSSLVHDVLFSDALILLVTAVVTFRTFGGEVLERELEDWGRNR